tara:strand:+ start:248 stop:430 length:183 start_codon:yes stop_codon:yes gene_type:complete
MANVKVDQKCTIFFKIKRENYQIRVKQSFFYFLITRIKLSFFLKKKNTDLFVDLLTNLLE